MPSPTDTPNIGSPKAGSTATAKRQPTAVRSDDQAGADQLALLQEILDGRLLEAHFQPILDFRTGDILGYEGLIRGPVDTTLRTPEELFRAATKHAQTLRLERLCRLTVLERYASLALPHKLFLNVRPQCLALPGLSIAGTLDLLRRLHLTADCIVIELTENLPFSDYATVRGALENYRRLGFEVAIDDLGEGFASFRLWSELRPEYVKADMHFVQGIERDPFKLQFLASIQQIARSSNALIIAEGIETAAELSVIRDLGIAFGQGFLISPAAARPLAKPPSHVLALLNGQRGSRRQLEPRSAASPDGLSGRRRGPTKLDR